VHYHFTTREAMEKDIAEGLFLETATVHNNIYGTSRRAVQDTLEAGKVAILDVGEWPCT
jgi:guanylate kinase